MSSTLLSKIRAHRCHPWLVSFFLCWPLGALAQEEPPEPAPEASASPFEETIKPTWETQKQARTYVLDIPAPRGQITARNGAPLAQNKLNYNLAIDFPTPLDFSDDEALAFARTRIREAQRRLDRALQIPDAAIIRHYHNRGFLPFEIAQNLTEEERAKLTEKLPSGTLAQANLSALLP